jgi:hypothetical protein
LIDRRGLTETEIATIQKDVFNGLYVDADLARLFETIAVQRRALKELFGYFQSEPLKRVSTADPVRNSQLAYLKELVRMEELTRYY